MHTFQSITHPVFRTTTALVIDTLSSAREASARLTILDRLDFLYDRSPDSELETDWLRNRRCSCDHVMQAKANFRSDEELTLETSAFQIFLGGNSTKFQGQHMPNTLCFALLRVQKSYLLREGHEQSKVQLEQYNMSGA